MSDVPPTHPGRVYALDAYRRAVEPHLLNPHMPQAHLMLHRLAQSFATLRMDRLDFSRFIFAEHSTLHNFTLDFLVGQDQVLRARLNVKASPVNSRVEACIFEPDHADINEKGLAFYQKATELMLVGPDRFAAEARQIVFEWATTAAHPYRVMRGQVQIMREREETSQAVCQRFDFPGTK